MGWDSEPELLNMPACILTTVTKRRQGQIPASSLLGLLPFIVSSRPQKCCALCLGVTVVSLVALNPPCPRVSALPGITLRK